MYEIRIIDTSGLRSQEDQIRVLLAQLSSKPDREIFFDRVLAESQADLVGAYRDNVLVGIMLVFRLDCFFRTKLFLEEIVVAETERGKGCLRAMIAFCEATYSAGGCSQIDLTARRPDAQAAYQKLGFARIDAFRLIFE